MRHLTIGVVLATALAAQPAAAQDLTLDARNAPQSSAPATARLFAGGVFLGIVLLAARRHARVTARVRSDG